MSPSSVGSDLGIQITSCFKSTGREVELSRDGVRNTMHQEIFEANVGPLAYSLSSGNNWESRPNTSATFGKSPNDDQGTRTPSHMHMHMHMHMDMDMHSNKALSKFYSGKLIQRCKSRQLRQRPWILSAELPPLPKSDKAAAHAKRLQDYQRQADIDEVRKLPFLGL